MSATRFEMVDVRCPGCGCLWFKAAGAVVFEIRCRSCRQTFTMRLPIGGVTVDRLHLSGVESS